MGQGPGPRGRREVAAGGVQRGVPTIDCPNRGWLPARRLDDMSVERTGVLVVRRTEGWSPADVAERVVGVGIDIGDLLLVGSSGERIARAEKTVESDEVRNCVLDGYRYRGQLDETEGRCGILFEA